MDNNYRNILETFGKVVYSHKTHEKAAERLDKKIRMLKITSIILLSITSVGVFSSVTDIVLPLLKRYQDFAIIFDVSILLISLLATGLSVYDLSSADKEELQQHKETINELIKIREKYLFVIADFKDGIIDTNELLEQRDKLFDNLMAIYEKAPKTTNKDYIKASNALKKNEEYTFNPGEVERFLPTSLRQD
ncbi:SLATT domain-containing protein [Streptomyces albidoflavus]|uniref:SLATT domain-containing protein n=1 Tax=Streptomyces albidoflavus TaxID=1886 RepID=UPI0033252F90